jgi:hypothetical protein
VTRDSRAQMLDSDTSDNPPFDEKCVGFTGSRARARVRARAAANFGNFGHPDTRGTVKFVKFPSEQIQQGRLPTGLGQPNFRTGVICP